MFSIILKNKSQRRTGWTLNHEESGLLLESNQDQNIYQKRNYRSASSICLYLLPLSCWGRRFFPSLKRTLTVIFLIPIVLGMLVIAYGGMPPSFSMIKAYENSLAQHDWSKLKPSLGHKYLSFPDHIWGHGFNNVLQEILLTSYIAYATNRTFVFDDYVWSHLPIPYTLYDFSLRPTRIPLNAFISGPTAGSNVPTSMNRAISADYFDYICPPSARVSIKYSSPFVGNEGNGLDIVNGWRERLNKDDVRNTSCLEIRETESRIFDVNFFGSPRILPLFPDLRDSPILENFTWSPLINSALDNTAIELFSPDTLTPNQTIPGLIAIHLRSGDYKRHCFHLAKWGSSYMGFNQFEGLVDSFNGSNVDDYLEHCLPTIPQVVRRLNEIRAEHSSTLSRVYILTNAWPSYITTLSSALLADSWENVSSTSDIGRFLNKEQRYVDVVVDMALAVDKAEVFVGNGFISKCSDAQNSERVACELESIPVKLLFDGETQWKHHFGC